MPYKHLAKRIRTGKYQGDDHYSWAVFIDDLPFVAGLGKSELPYYKKLAMERLIAKENKYAK